MRLPSKSATFAVLMVVAAVCAFLLPASWTSWARGPFQTLSLPQWAASWVTRQAANAAAGAVSPQRVSAVEAARLRAENDELRAQVVNLQLTLERMEQAFEEVSALRGALPDSHVLIIRAPVVGFDANPHRRTLQIAIREGTRARVRVGQWVVAGLPQAGARDVVLRQWLIGQVCEVRTQLARVQLTTDPAFRAEVRVARLDISEESRGANPWWRLEISPDACLLEGGGDGRLVISQAPRDYLAEGYDLITAGVGRGQPVALVLGRIEAAARRTDSAQHFDLAAVPWGSAERLTHVYIVATDE